MLIVVGAAANASEELWAQFGWDHLLFLIANISSSAFQVDAQLCTMTRSLGHWGEIAVAINSRYVQSEERVCNGDR